MMRDNRAGFSKIELLMVIVISAILTGMVAPAVARQHSERQVANARDAFIWMSARARATAIERGETVRLEIDGQTVRVVAETPDGDEVLQARNFMDQFGTAVQSGNAVRVCYTNRGFARQACGAVGLESNLGVTFTRGEATARARIGALGRVERS